MNPKGNANRIGIPWRLSSASLSRTAQHHFAGKRILRTRTRQSVATSYILQKEKEEVTKAAVCFCSSKAGNVAAKESGRARAKAKESLERIKIIARARGQRVRTIEV
jgi:hypothetical protein